MGRKIKFKNSKIQKFKKNVLEAQFVIRIAQYEKKIRKMEYEQNRFPYLYSYAL